MALYLELPMPHPSVLAEFSPPGSGPPGCLRIRLARPERRNALDVGMTRALLDSFRADPAVPVLIDSADPRAFCAGADLSLPDSGRAVVSDLLYECYEVMITRPAPQPRR